MMMDELVRNQTALHEWSVVFHRESNSIIIGFQTVQADVKNESGKKRGDRLAAFIYNRPCQSGHITMKEYFCSPDIELLLIRTQRVVVVVVVYVPPPVS